MNENTLAAVGIVAVVIMFMGAGYFETIDDAECPTYYDGEGNELSHHEVDSIVKCAYVVCDPKND